MVILGMERHATFEDGTTSRLWKVVTTAVAAVVSWPFLLLHLGGPNCVVAGVPELPAVLDLVQALV